MIAPDSSAAIAALRQWHPAHEASRAALGVAGRTLVGHVACETASTLSRMPEPYRVAPAVVFEALDRAYPAPWLMLDSTAHRSSLRRAIVAGLRGGALYDALIAATASEHGATLLSVDRRASAAYEAMGAEVLYL